MKNISGEESPFKAKEATYKVKIIEKIRKDIQAN